MTGERERKCYKLVWVKAKANRDRRRWNEKQGCTEEGQDDDKKREIHTKEVEIFFRNEKNSKKTKEMNPFCH